jgi:hypothetical protein
VAGVMNSALLPLTLRVESLLNNWSPPSELVSCHEERKFQLAVYSFLKNSLGPESIVLGEASGGGIRAIRLWGAGSWPDLTISSTDSPLQLAIELKCLWTRSLPNRVAHALGQALLYLERPAGGYDNALVTFIVTEPIEFNFPDELRARLASHEIGVSIVWACKREAA